MYNYESEDEKGLFTFYREQAVREDEIRIQKLQQKLEKSREKQRRQKLKQSLKSVYKVKLQPKPQIIKKPVPIRKKYISQQKLLARKPLYQPRYSKQKYQQHSPGQSVIIIRDPTQLSYDNINDKSKKKQFQVKEMINSQNCNKYFLQNKQLHVQFGNSTIQKQILSQKQDSKQKSKLISVKMSYFNSSGQQLEQRYNKQKYMPHFSYSKLPEITNRKERSNLFISSMRSQGEPKLKTRNSQIMKTVRNKMRGELSYERNSQKQFQSSYINYHKVFLLNDQKQKEHQALCHQDDLNDKQKKLVNIIHRAYVHKRRT